MTEIIETFTKTAAVHTDRYVYLYIHIFIFVNVCMCINVYVADDYG